MLIKATGKFPSCNRKLQEIKLIFYGESLSAIRSWLHRHKTEKFAFSAEARVYVGEYQKTSYGMTEEFSGMKARHQGYGKASLGFPGVAKGTKTAFKGLGIVQKRKFIGISVTKFGKDPHFMHHEKSCRYVGSIEPEEKQSEYGTFTLAQIHGMAK